MNADPIDARAAKLAEIIEWYTAHSASVVSESDTRLKMIDRILREALGWEIENTQTEEDAGEGRLDYRYTVGCGTRAVVEAKRTTVNFEIPSHRSGQAFLLNGPVFGVNARYAIKQVVTYCAFKSAELACCTNGNQWIIFRGNRLGDGRDVLEGKGYIFASLPDVQGAFSLFHDLLSRESLTSLRFRGVLQQAEGVKLRNIGFARSIRTQDTRRLLPRDAFAIDFEMVMSSFFQRLKGETDADMIGACFVVSDESERAESRITRIADDLVHKVRELNTDTGRELANLISQVQQLHKNRFVLLVGTKGAGKSTFIDRFFAHVLPKNILDGLVLIRADLLHCDGNIAHLHNWLNSTLLSACENSVYGTEGPDWNETIGAMFWKEYKRWKTTTKKVLYEQNKPKFDIQFGDYVEECRKLDPHDYIKRLLGNVVRSRKKVPCLILDNTDHHSIEFQEAVFQYARSLYEAELCMVIMPITDRTSWQLSKQGVLQSFESEVLHLPVPEAYRVVERRIHYLSEKISEAKSKQNASYFIGRNIRLDVNDIEKFAHALNRIFVESQATSEWIGALVNYDVRRLLELVKNIVSSPHLTIDRLFAAHTLNDADVIAPWRIKQAIIKGGYDIYPSGEHQFVQNCFQLIEDPPTSPLLCLRILQFLRDVPPANEGEVAAFVPISEVYEYFAAMGFESRSITQSIERMLAAGLVLNYDPSVSTVEKLTKIEISPSGRIHLLWGTTDEDYIKTMAQVTAIRDENTFQLIYGYARNMAQNWANVLVSFVDYLQAEDRNWCNIPTHKHYSGQGKLLNRLNRVAEDAKRTADARGGFTRFSSKYTEPRNHGSPATKSE